jgi:hypothetical protein
LAGEKLGSALFAAKTNFNISQNAPATHRHTGSDLFQTANGIKQPRLDVMMMIASA